MSEGPPEGYFGKLDPDPRSSRWKTRVAAVLALALLGLCVVAFVDHERRDAAAAFQFGPHIFTFSLGPYRVKAPGAAVLPYKQVTPDSPFGFVSMKYCYPSMIPSAILVCNLARDGVLQIQLDYGHTFDPAAIAAASEVVYRDPGKDVGKYKAYREQGSGDLFTEHLGDPRVPAIQCIFYYSKDRLLPCHAAWLYRSDLMATVSFDQFLMPQAEDIFETVDKIFAENVSIHKQRS